MTPSLPNRLRCRCGAGRSALIAAWIIWARRSGPLGACVSDRFWPEKLTTLFLLTIIPGLVVVAIVAFGLREPPHTELAGKKFSLSRAPLDRNFRLYLAALAVFTLGNSSDLFLLTARPSIWA